MSSVMRFVGLIAVLLLGACADHALEARRAYIASLVGGSETDLVRQMGVPTRSFSVNGETFLAYDNRRLEFVPGFYGGPPWWGPGWGPWGWWASPPLAVERGCETTFEVRDGKVVSFSRRGPEC